MGYTKTVMKGFGWQISLKFVLILTAVVKLKFLSLFLLPVDFGLFSLVIISLGVIEAASETGINTTMIQSSRSHEYYLDTAWVIAIVRGIVIAICLIVSGVVLTKIYGEPSLLSLFGAMSFVPFIKGFINPSIVILQKNFLFRSDFWFRCTLVGLETLAAVGLVYLWRTPFALVMAMIIAAVAEVMFSFMFFGSKPVFRLFYSRAKDIILNARGLSISSFLSYVTQNADNFIIGKMLGTHSLGLYSNAYGLAHKPNIEIARSFQSSIFPVLVKFIQDKNRVRNAFLKSIAGCMALCLILSAPFVFFPKVLIGVLLSEKWMEVSTILPILVTAGVIHSFSAITHSLLTADKNYLWLNLSLGINAVVMCLGLLIVTPGGGLESAAWIVLISRICSLPFIIYGAKISLWQESRHIQR